MTEAEKIELKGAIARIAYSLFDIDAKMKPSLHDRLKGEFTDQQVQDIYDLYVEEVAEEFVNRIERKLNENGKESEEHCQE